MRMHDSTFFSFSYLRTQVHTEISFFRKEVHTEISSYIEGFLHAFILMVSIYAGGYDRVRGQIFYIYLQEEQHFSVALPPGRLPREYVTIVYMHDNM
jgi:hypothetical protein